MSSTPPTPTYDLAEIQRLVREGKWLPSGTALRGAAELGWVSDDIRDCVLALTGADLHKTMPSTDHPGLWQDVYKPFHNGVRLYVKLQVGRRGVAVVVSFKEK